MSVQNELKQRLNLQEGDELIFVRDLYQKYVTRRLNIVGTPPLFKKSKMHGNVIIKRHSGKMGMYTEEGESVISEDDHKCWPEFYDDGQYFHEVICVQKKGLTEVRSYDGKKQIVPRICNSVHLDTRYITIHKSRYIGAYSYEGKEILPTELILKDEVRQAGDFAFICTNKETLCGVYSEDGEELIPFGDQRITYRWPFFEVRKADGNNEIYTFTGEKLPLDNADRFQWIDNEEPYMFTNTRGYNFILAFKDGMRAALYTYDGTKIADNLYKYAKMYLEKKYIICIGRDGVTMDVYNFEGKKIAQIEP